MSSQELIETARALVGQFPLREGSAASVGAALLAASGRVYTGVCVDLACGLGFCAEQGAVAKMLEQREVRVIEMVAVGAQGIIPPCGRCRELVLQLSAENSTTRVLLPGDRALSLAELMPHHWL